MPDLGLAPGDSHDSHGAIKGWNIEIDRGGAVVLHLDDAGIVAERLLRRCRCGKGSTTIATRVQTPAFTLHAINQHAIDVAQFGCQALLVEVVFLRCRWFVTRQIEDAGIDCRNCDECLLAGSEISDLNRDSQLLTRFHDFRRSQLDVESARRAVDAEPGQPHGARWHALGLHIHWLIETGQHIGASSPVFANREGHGDTAFGHINGLRRQQPVADDLHRRLAGIAGLDLDGHRAAGRRIGGIERHFQRVRRIGLRCIAVVIASREIHAGRRHAFSGELEAVFAPGQSAREIGRLVTGQIKRAAGDLRGAGDALPAPLAIGLEPLPVTRQALQGPGSFLGGDELASLVDRDDLESRGLAFRGCAIVEFRLEAEHRLCRFNG